MFVFLFVCLLVCLFVGVSVCLFVNEFDCNSLGHGDLHALPCPGLQRGHILKTLTSFRKCNFKEHACLDKSFLDVRVHVFALDFIEL